MRRSALTLFIVALLGLAFPAAGSAAVLGGDCSNRRLTTIVANDWIRVARYGSRYQTWLACWRKDLSSDASLRGEILVDADFGDSGFPPPALALAATTLAYAVTFESEEEAGYYFTRIFVDRFFRQSEHGHSEGWASLHATHAGDRDRATVGSTVVRPNGAVAWISSPVKGGTSRTVYRVLSKDLGKTVPVDEENEEGVRDVLDRGRGIDSRSLRRRGDRISWVKNGRRRYATLK